jgi:hypothetical protein
MDTSELYTRIEEDQEYSSLFWAWTLLLARMGVLRFGDGGLHSL